MKLRKIISLFAATSILAMSLASCERSPEKLMEKANKKLTRLDYTVEVDIDYTAKDSLIAPLFEELEKNDTKLHFEGDNVSIENRTSISYEGGDTEFYSSYTVVDGMVYASSGYTVSDGSNLNKLKAEISDEEKETLIEKAGLIIDVGIEDFATVTLDKLDGEHCLICTDASSDLNVLLERIMISQLQNTADSVGVKNVRMVIVLDGGKIDTVSLECEYDVTLYTYNYSVEAEFELEYDYDDFVKVKAPANAGEYPYSTFDDILNTL